MSRQNGRIASSGERRGGATAIHFLMGAWAGLAVLLAAVAITFRWFGFSEPKWLLRVFQGVALLATILRVPSAELWQGACAERWSCS
jgi:hypothetical protein